MGWIPRWGSLWMVLSSVSAPNFVSVTPFMRILFPILRKNEVSTLWSSFFLSFMCFANCILGIPSFWGNMHLSVSAYHVYSLVGSLVPGALGFLVGSYCCFSSYGATNPFSSLGTFSSSFIGDPVLRPMDGCEHPLLYLSGTGRAYQ